MIRVASVPASHVYVRHLASPDDEMDVIRLPDPVPTNGSTAPGVWWPPAMLDPVWIQEHQSEFDVFHIHFGFDALSLGALSGIVHALKFANKPLVYTVHDLRNPHHADPRMHTAQLDILMSAADALITLTPGAADRIRERWGREAVVLPHPHVIERSLFGDVRPTRNDEFVVGVHAKSLRANVDILPVVETLAEAVDKIPNALLRIDIHDEVFDSTKHAYAPETGRRLLEYADRANVVVDIHPYFTDDQLWAYMSSLSVSVLPYRFGTHSGWLEACHDLGTAVVAPSCGFYDQQQDQGVFIYERDESSLDPNSLKKCIRRAYQDHELVTATWEERLTQRRFIAAAHRDVYASLLARGEKGVRPR